MILDPDIRSQFTVFLFLEDLNQGADLRGQLAVSGYEVFMFRDQDLVIDRVREAAPHLLVFEIEALQTTLSEFVDAVLEANPEVLFLPLATAQQAMPLQDYREFNFAGLVTKGEERDLRLLWQVDQICSELFFQYQNESLLDEKGELEKVLDSRDEEIRRLRERNNELEAIEPFEAQRELELYANVRSKEEAVDVFLKHLQQKCLRRDQELHALVLKFLPTVQSFVATQSLNLEIENLKGIGARLEKEEAADLFAFLQSGRFPSQLIQLMDQGFQVGSFVGKPLLLPDSVEALFVLWVKGGGLQAADFENEFVMLQLVYQNIHLLRRLKDSDPRDPVTDLEIRDFYFKKLEEEVARARRLQKAVSVVKVSIDHLTEIEQAYGVGGRDSVLRTVATLIRRTSRVNDLTCRSEDNEISLILPHCARKGAAIRAERIRRMIENHAFNLGAHRVSVSLGVSEYPSLCGSSEDLEKTTAQALNFIQEKGGNKVCLYRPRQDFKPDFDVPPL